MFALSWVLLPNLTLFKCHSTGYLVRPRLSFNKPTCQEPQTDKLHKMNKNDMKAYHHVKILIYLVDTTKKNAPTQEVGGILLSIYARTARFDAIAPGCCSLASKQRSTTWKGVKLNYHRCRCRLCARAL